MTPRNLLSLTVVLLCRRVVCFSPAVSSRVSSGLKSSRFQSLSARSQVPRETRVFIQRDPRGGENQFGNFLDELPLGPILSISLLFAFPGFFLGLFNTFFLAFFVLPPLLGFGFQLWANANLITADCPNCSAPVQGFKSSPETLCFTCGTELVQNADKDGWRIRSKYDSDPYQSSNSSPSDRVIDVEAIDV